MLSSSTLHLNPYSSTSNYPIWMLNNIPAQSSQIRKSCSFIKTHYNTELFTSINPNAITGEPQKNWLRHFTDIDEGKYVPNDSCFLSCFLLALTVDPTLTFEQKSHFIKQTINDLNEISSIDFFRRIPTLPPVIISHILLYSSQEIKNKILEKINTPHAALISIQTAFKNQWSIEEKSTYLNILQSHFNRFDAKSKNRVSKCILSHASKDLLLWIERTSPSLYTTITEPTLAPNSTQPSQGPGNSSPPEELIKGIKFSLNFLKSYYDIELTTPITVLPFNQSSKTWLQYFIDIEKNNPISYDSCFLCCFFFSIAANPHLDATNKCEISRKILTDLNENELSEFFKQLPFLPHLISSHLLLFLTKEVEFTILNEIQDGSTALSLIEAIFNNIWSLANQQEALELLNNHLSALPDLKKQEIYTYIQEKAPSEVLVWMKLSSPEMHTAITTPLRIPLEEINNKA